MAGGALLLDISGAAGHAHTVQLTAGDIRDIAEGKRISEDSSTRPRALAHRHVQLTEAARSVGQWRPRGGRVSDVGHRTHRAGEPIVDLCRACKVERDHTVMAVDGDGRAVRVVCDFCGSQHNYRGGGDEPAPAPAAAQRPPAAPRLKAEHEGTVPVSHDRRLRTTSSRSSAASCARSSASRPGAPAPKWRGGQLLLRPGKPGLQEKAWPVDALFHKIVMIRNRLRTLEQQLNAAEIPEDLKLRLQAYVTACYGSLTSFNVLFADEADQFRGAGGDD